MDGTLNKKKLPSKDIFFFRQRLKNKIFQSVLSHFADLAKEKNLAKKDIANLLNKDPSQITRWFAGPNNWTLDTISDLLLAMDAELKHEIVSLHEDRQYATNINRIMGLSAEPRVPFLEAHNPQVGDLLSSKVVLSHKDKDHVESLQYVTIMFEKAFKASSQENRSQTAGHTLKPTSQRQGTPNTLSGIAATIH